MAEHPDLSYWQLIGGAITGILTGAGAVAGAKRKARSATGDKVRADMRELQDKVLTMTQDISNMKEAHKQHLATLERLEHEHDIVIAELFRELKQIGLALREVAVEVRCAINNKGEHH